jgi:hypothetical protein
MGGDMAAFDDNGYEMPARATYPIPNTNAATYSALGAKHKEPILIEGTISDDKVGRTPLKGEFIISYGSENRDGDVTPGYVVAVLDNDYSPITSRYQQMKGNNRMAADGRIVETSLRQADILYLPAPGSTMHVGMFTALRDTIGVTGIFGDKTTTTEMTALPTGGSGRYNGVANLEIHNEPTREGFAYKGDMTADVAFNTASIRYQSDGMTKWTDTSGPRSITVDGTATYAANGEINGTFTASGSGLREVSGHTSGAFYGPNGESIGLRFGGVGIAGGAIMGQ